MDKDRQIEEMAGCVHGGSPAYRLEVAQAIYNKDYRKKLKGEWKVRIGMAFGIKYLTCSVCGAEEKEHYGVMPKFCFSCGSENE